MLEKILSRMDNRTLSLFLDEEVTEYLKSQSKFSDFFDNSKKLIELVMIQDCIKMIRDPKYRLLLFSYLSEEEKDELSYALNKPDTLTNQSIYSLSFSGRNKETLMTFFNVDVEVIDDVQEYENFIDVHPTRFYELMNYQYVIKEQMFRILEKNPPLYRGLIHMPTGTGKTKTTNHIVISDYIFNKKNKGVLLWLAHTKELLQQAYGTFYSTWNVLGNQSISAKMNDVDYVPKNNTIIFMSYQKLISLRKNNSNMFEQLIKNVVGIVADEAHKCLARETGYAIESLMVCRPGDNNKYLIGLSATPGRKFDSVDESLENQDLANMFEKRILTIDINKVKQLSYTNYDLENIEKHDKRVIKYFQDQGILSRIKREIIHYVAEEALPKSKGDADFDQKVLRQFATIKTRNEKIIDRLIELNKNETPTIIFACNVNHAKFISTLLLIHGIKSSTVFGEMSKEVRNQNIKDFQDGKVNFIINFEVLTTGFDSPRIECVFITRPTNSIVLYSQMLGRGLRGPKMGGNSECLLIDISDNYEKFSDENRAFDYFTEYWGE